MANRFIKVDPKINTLGYDDFMKPLIQLQKEHDIEKAKIEKEEDILLQKLGELNAIKGDDGMWSGVDAKAANYIQDKITSLENLSKKLAISGVKDGTLSKEARALYKDILPTYTKIINNAAYKNKIAEEQRNIILQGYLVDKNISDVDVMDIDPNFSYASWNPNVLETLGTQHAKTEAGRLGVTYTVNKNSGVDGQDEIIVTPNVTYENLASQHDNDDGTNLWRTYAKNELMNRGLTAEQAEAMIQNNLDTMRSAYNRGVTLGIPAIQSSLTDDLDVKKRLQQLQMDYYNTRNNNGKNGSGRNTPNDYSPALSLSNPTYKTVKTVELAADKDGKLPTATPGDNDKKIEATDVNSLNEAIYKLTGESIPPKELEAVLNKEDIFIDKNGVPYYEESKTDSPATDFGASYIRDSNLNALRSISHKNKDGASVINMNAERNAIHETWQRYNKKLESLDNYKSVYRNTGWPLGDYNKNTNMYTTKDLTPGNINLNNLASQMKMNKGNAYFGLLVDLAIDKLGLYSKQEYSEEDKWLLYNRSIIMEALQNGKIQVSLGKDGVQVKVADGTFSEYKGVMEFFKLMLAEGYDVFNSNRESVQAYLNSIN